MTVPTSHSRVQYDGNDAATEFDYTFKIFDADDLVVVLTDVDDNETTLVRGSDYNVDGVGDEAGGTVTYPISGTPLATGETLTILREIPVAQETDLRNQGRFYPETIEDEFDRSRMIDQQQEEELGRTLKKTQGGDHYDAGGARIENLGTPSSPGNPGDTVNVEFLKAYIASIESGEVGDATLVTATGTVDQRTLADWTKALGYPTTSTGTDQPLTEAIDQRTASVGSVVELSALTPSVGQQSSVSGDTAAMYEWTAGDFSAQIDGFEFVAWDGDTSPGATGAWVLFDRAVKNQYSAQFLQTTSDILNNIPVDLLRFIPKSQHSAIKDYTNTSDNSAQIQEANDALTSVGGTILLPRGRLGLSSVVLPSNRVNFKGQGRSSQIYANPDMANDTMFRFANGTSSMFSSRLDDCWLRVEGVAAVKQAVVAEAWQENCGARGLVINGLDAADKRGIVIKNGFGGAAYLRLEDLEIFGSNMAAGVDVEEISVVGGFLLDVRGATITGATGAPAVAAIKMANDSLVCDGLHVEYCSNGVLLNDGSRASLRAITGSSNEVTNLVVLASTWTGDLHAQMLIPNGATTTIRDNATGFNKTGVITEFNYSASISPSNAKGLVTFDGTTGTITSSYGVSSVTRNATGDYTVTWTGSLGSDYSVFVDHRATNQRVALHSEVSKAATEFRFRTREWIGGSGDSAVTVDPTEVRVVAYAIR